MPTPTPTPPTLKPFDPTVTPNLMSGGPYDAVLTQIMEYLASLKSFLDEQFTTLESDVDELGTELNDLSGSVGAWDKNEHRNVSMAEFCENLTGAYSLPLPVRIDSSGTAVEKRTTLLFNVSNNGEHSTSDYLGALISSLMLAAPNGDHTQLFGYLGDNTADLLVAQPTVRSSAALTYAAESGGTSGNVYGVPVDLASDGTATLAVGGSVTIHQNETLFVCSSEYEGFTAGTIAEYSGSSSVELSDSAGQNIAAELVAVYVPTGGTAEVPVGTLSVQGVANQVCMKTVEGTVPVSSVVYCRQLINNPLLLTSPALQMGVYGDNVGIDASKPNEGSAPSRFTVPMIYRAESPNEPLTSQDLAIAQKVPFLTTDTDGYILFTDK